MNKNLKKFIKIFLTIILIIFGINFYKEIKKIIIKDYYDYIVVGNNCNCQIFGNDCKQTYGIKNGEISELNIKFDKQMSNIYDVDTKGNEITYFDISLKSKDKEILKKILNLLSEKKMKKIYYIDYFIITEKNYYIFAYINSKYSIYKYNEKDNKLPLLIELNTCKLDYFYEK